MYCAQCGRLMWANAKFCDSCGSPVNRTTSEQSTEAPRAPKLVAQPKVVLLYIAAVILFGGYVALFVEAIAGKPPDSQLGYGCMFWTGMIFYYWWKRRSRKGWHG